MTKAPSFVPHEDLSTTGLVRKLREITDKKYGWSSTHDFNIPRETDHVRGLLAEKLADRMPRVMDSWSVLVAGKMDDIIDRLVAWRERKDTPA